MQPSISFCIFSKRDRRFHAISWVKPMTTSKKPDTGSHCEKTILHAFPKFFRKILRFFSLPKSKKKTQMLNQIGFTSLSEHKKNREKTQLQIKTCMSSLFTSKMHSAFIQILTTPYQLSSHSFHLIFADSIPIVRNADPLCRHG